MLRNIEEYLELQGGPNRPRRDITSLVATVVLAVPFFAAAVWLLDDPTWWRVTLGMLAVILLLILAGVAADYAALVPRDEKGKRLPPSRSTRPSTASD